MVFGIFLASNLDRVQQHLRLELTKKQKEKEDYERLIQELAVSELEEKESQNEKVSHCPKVLWTPSTVRKGRSKDFRSY